MATTSKKSSKKSNVANNSRTEATPQIQLNKNLRNYSIDDLSAEIDARKAHDADEARKRLEQLRTEEAEVQKKLAMLTGKAPGKQRGAKPGSTRVRNKVPLSQVLVSILDEAKGHEMSIKDLVENVEKTEFKTTSDNLYSVVYSTLKTNDKLFEKREKGVFALKSE